MTPKQIKISKYLSFILRHDPAAGGVVLDPEGWANVDELLGALAGRDLIFTREELIEVVAVNDKQRFAITEDGSAIRASQGHSVQVELGYIARVPPETLWHGTAERFLEPIMLIGLIKRGRQHVHLSLDRSTAVKVGSRHGRPVVLVIRAGQMNRDGFEFFLSDNGVWLTDQVPSTYISVETGE